MNRAQVLNVIDIKKQLDLINFNKVLLEDSAGLNHLYDPNSQNNQHKYTQGGHTTFSCTICDNQGWHLPNDPTKRGTHSLKNVSHGTHTFDYLQACGKDLNTFDFSAWSDIPVLFLFENPSNDKGIYIPTYNKRPAKRWYWVSDDCHKINFAGKNKHIDSFSSKYYNGMVYSLIDLFKLGNAYVTNVVKCGMNNNNGDGYLDTSQYNPECIKSCLEKILKEEIKALTNQGQKPLIIFAFGTRTYKLINEAMDLPSFSSIKPNTTLIEMPHPACFLNNDFRPHIIFGQAYFALKKQIPNEADQALQIFIKEMS